MPPKRATRPSADVSSAVTEDDSSMASSTKSNASVSDLYTEKDIHAAVVNHIPKMKNVFIDSIIETERDMFMPSIKRWESLSEVERSNFNKFVLHLFISFVGLGFIGGLAMLPQSWFLYIGTSVTCSVCIPLVSVLTRQFMSAAPFITTGVAAYRTTRSKKVLTHTNAYDTAANYIVTFVNKYYKMSTLNDKNGRNMTQAISKILRGVAVPAKAIGNVSMGIGERLFAALWLACFYNLPEHGQIQTDIDTDKRLAVQELKRLFQLTKTVSVNFVKNVAIPKLASMVKTIGRGMSYTYDKYEELLAYNFDVVSHASESGDMDSMDSQAIKEDVMKMDTPPSSSSSSSPHPHSHATSSSSRRSSKRSSSSSSLSSVGSRGSTVSSYSVPSNRKRSRSKTSHYSPNGDTYKKTKKSPHLSSGGSRRRKTQRRHMSSA